jgi:hypothetical protein
MSTEVSFCPLCAGKLDSEKNDRFVCDDCETRFFIQVVDEEDEDDDDDDDNGDEDDEEEEKDDEDEY